jgi:quercetin 2,3-dioxygenase
MTGGLPEYKYMTMIMNSYMYKRSRRWALAMSTIIKISKLGSRWEASDPFLFCVHHNDSYPRGNEEMGPDASLEGRNLGSDFQVRDGWSMYHGERIPGFPEHPHRGFETVTAVLKGFIDHFDSTGAAGRFGAGDVQWMTAGKGARHSEMFPLLNTEDDNPLELFQIWLNLPKKDKFTEPHYKMLWAEDIPVVQTKDAKGKMSTIRLIAGNYEGRKSLEPSPGSWAKDGEHHVGIWIISMEPEAVMELPQVSKTLNRTIYYYSGDKIKVDNTNIDAYHSVKLLGDERTTIENGSKESYMLLLEGEPIGEPVVSYGPFVMNTQREISEAYEEFRKTGFGNWEWHSSDPVHPREKGRFAQYSDGTVEERGDTCR